MDIKAEIQKIDKRIEGMTAYLLLKVDHKDWHAVADAAMDIRELEARKKTLEEVERS